MGWGAPGLGDDLGWGGEATRDAQGCGGGPPPLGLLERDIIGAQGARRAARRVAASQAGQFSASGCPD